MNTTSPSSPDLATRLQDKLTRRLNQTQNMFDQQLTAVEKRLNLRLKDAENSITDGLSRLSEVARIGRYRLWLAPLIVGLSLTLGLGLGSAASISLLTSMIAERVQTLQQTEQALQVLAMSGVDTQRYQGKLYLITQPGAPRPGVYQHQHHPDQWVVMIEEE